MSSSVVDLVNKARLEKAEKQQKSSGGGFGSTSTPAKEPKKDIAKEETPAKNTAPQQKADQDDLDKSEPMPKKDVSNKKTEDGKAEVSTVPKMLHHQRRVVAPMQMAGTTGAKRSSAEANAAVPLAQNAAVPPARNAVAPLAPNAAVPLEPNAAVPLARNAAALLVPNAAVPLVPNAIALLDKAAARLGQRRVARLGQRRVQAVHNLNQQLFAHKRSHITITGTIFHPEEWLFFKVPLIA